MIQQYVRQCVLAIHHLHCNEIAHRDVNVENIMVASDGTIKLAGIGTGSLSDEAATPSATGSALARAMAVDIWDLGLVVLDMALGIQSGRGLRDKYPCPELGLGAAAGAYADAADMLDIVPPVPAFLSADATKFVVSCLIPKAKVRPSAEELLRMPFVQVRRRVSARLRTAVSVPSRAPPLPPHLTSPPRARARVCTEYRKLRPPRRSQTERRYYCAGGLVLGPRASCGESRTPHAPVRRRAPSRCGLTNR